MNLSDLRPPALIGCLLALASLLSACQGPADPTDANQPAVDKPAIGSNEDISERWKAILQQPETPEVMEEKRRLYVEVLRRYNDSKTRDFEVSGSVVDEEGRPLEDVTIAYSFSTTTGWDQEKSQGGKQQVDGSFQVKGGKWQRLNFDVRKEGYYDEHFAFYGPPRGADAGRASARRQAQHAEGQDRRSGRDPGQAGGDDPSARIWA